MNLTLTGFVEGGSLPADLYRLTSLEAVACDNCSLTGNRPSGTQGKHLITWGPHPCSTWFVDARETHPPARSLTLTYTHARVIRLAYCGGG